MDRCNQGGPRGRRVTNKRDTDELEVNLIFDRYCPPRFGKVRRIEGTRLREGTRRYAGDALGVVRFSTRRIPEKRLGNKSF